METNEITGKVIGAAIEVHKKLGPGLLESAYQVCLARELDLQGVRYSQERPLLINYKGVQLNCSYRLDFIVEEEIIVELKACDEILPIHEAQLLTYLRLSGLHTGLIINFNVPVLKEGIKRMKC